jgi:hypothetical protein
MEGLRRASGPDGSIVFAWIRYSNSVHPGGENLIGKQLGGVRTAVFYPVFAGFYRVFSACFRELWKIVRDCC